MRGNEWEYAIYFYSLTTEIITGLKKPKFYILTYIYN